MARRERFHGRQGAVERGVHREIDLDRHRTVENLRGGALRLSPKFADSQWCLDELVKIVRCVKKGGHVTMPVFFHVSPHDVAGQSGAYETAFGQHESVFRKKRVDNWRKALIAVAGISGWCFREHGSEAQLVEDISKEVQQTLEKIAGAKMDMITRIRSGGSKKSSDVSESSSGEEMNLFSYQVMEGLAVIRICGLDGVESTKSAKVVYDNVLGRREFFPDDHRRRLGFHENEQVQPDPELIWSRRVWDKDGDIHVVRSSLPDKKILVIVDDVEKLANLLRFAAGMGYLGSGSQVVISGVDVSKKVLKVVHINMEDVEGVPRGGGVAASAACHRCTKKYVDIACFVKGMVSGSELTNRIWNSLTAGGLPAEVVVKVRVERIENVEMVEDGKLDVKLVKYEAEPPAVLPASGGGKSKLPVDSGEELKPVTHRRLMEAVMVFCVVFFLTTVTPSKKQPLPCPRSTPAIPRIRGLNPFVRSYHFK